MAAAGNQWCGRLLGATASVVLLGLLASASDRLIGLLQNTTALILGSWALGMPIGVFLGVIVAKVDVPGRQLIRMLLLAALFVPLLVWAGAWQAALTRSGWAATWLPGVLGGGWLGGWPAAIWIHGTAGVAWAALLTATSLAAIERPLEEQSLIDAAGWQVLGWVSLRRAGAGIVAGALWIAATAATEIVATDLFQIRTFAEEAFVEASLGRLDDAGRLASTDFAAGWMILALATWLGLRAVAPRLPAVADASLDQGWAWRPGRARWLIGSLAVLITLGLFGAPMASLVCKAGLTWVDGVPTFSPGKATELILSSPWKFRREWQWTLLSGGVAATATTSLALLAGWLAARRPIFRGPLVAFAALLASVPGPLLGVATIRLLNHPPETFGYGLTHLYDRTLIGPIVVQTLRALPLALIFMWSQMTTIPPGLLDAARSEGAGWWTQLWRIAVPLRRRALAGCWLASLLIAAGETSGVLLVSPPGATLLSVRTFGLLHYGADDQVAAVCLSLIVLVAATASLFRWTPAAVRRRVAANGIESVQP